MFLRPSSSYLLSIDNSSFDFWNRSLKINLNLEVRAGPEMLSVQWMFTENSDCPVRSCSRLAAPGVRTSEQARQARQGQSTPLRVCRLGLRLQQRIPADWSKLNRSSELRQSQALNWQTSRELFIFWVNLFFLASFIELKWNNKIFETIVSLSSSLQQVEWIISPQAPNFPNLKILDGLPGIVEEAPAWWRGPWYPDLQIPPPRQSGHGREHRDCDLTQDSPPTSSLIIDQHWVISQHLNISALRYLHVSFDTVLHSMFYW